MESPASPSAPVPIAPVQGFEGRSPIAIRDIPVAFASGCKAVYPAFAPPAYRSLLIFHAGTHAFLVILDLPQAALYRAQCSRWRLSLRIIGCFIA